jgi:hypothetical protein
MRSLHKDTRGEGREGGDVIRVFQEKGVNGNGTNEIEIERKQQGIMRNLSYRRPTYSFFPSITYINDYLHLSGTLPVVIIILMGCGGAYK